MMRKKKNTDLEKTEDKPSERALEARRPWDLFEDMDRWFSDFRNEFDRKFWGSLSPLGVDGLAAREPTVDLVDSGREYVLTADLPGVSKENLDLQVTSNGIELGAETHSEKAEDGKDYAYRERSYRSFRRILPLPEEVLADQAKANLKDGVLEVRLPKKSPTPRQHPVKVRVE